MIMYLVALVVILCSIFGLTYSQSSIQAIIDGGERLSTIQLPSFMHRTPLIQHPQAGVEGDNGIATRSSQQSLEISSQGMEEVNRDEDQLRSDLYQLERRIFEQKLKDANQIGLAESLWQVEMQNESDKVIEDLLNKKYASETSKPAPQKINTNTIFNMIQYETFKEAMAVLKNQQEQEEAARGASTTNGQQEKSTENETKSLPDDEQKENLPAKDRNID